MVRAVQPTVSKSRWFTVLVYAVQFFFGGWFLFHGSNYFLAFFTQPPGSSPLTHEVISALIHSGLFSVVKAIEVAVGIAFLANRFVPIATVAAFPVSFSIAYVNFAANGDGMSILVAFVVIAFNGIVALGHMGRFWPMLAFNQGDPEIAGLTPSADDAPAVRARASLGGIAQVACILAGIAAPVGLTLLTTRSGGARDAAHYAQIAHEMDARQVLIAFGQSVAVQPSNPNHAKAYLAPSFIDHASTVGPDIGAIASAISSVSPDRIGDAGDLAIISHPNGAVDIFRVAEGKIAEHWLVRAPSSAQGRS